MYLSLLSSLYDLSYINYSLIMILILLLINIKKERVIYNIPR